MGEGTGLQPERRALFELGGTHSFPAGCLALAFGGAQGFRDLGVRDLGVRDLGVRDLGFRGLGFRGFRVMGFWVLGLGDAEGTLVKG